MYDKLKLTKELYEDPSIYYIGTEFEGLDAYERQLKRFEIKEENNEKEENTEQVKTTCQSI